MGYFSNGTEGELYMEKHCVHCANNHHEEGCAVLDAHMFDMSNDTLDFLIPRSKDNLGNDKCRMFRVADPERCMETPDMFEMERIEA